MLRQRTPARLRYGHYVANCCHFRPLSHRPRPSRRKACSCVTSRTRFACWLRTWMTAILSPLAMRIATSWRRASTSLDALSGSSGYFARAIEIVCATRLCARRSSGSRAFSAWDWFRNRSDRALSLVSSSSVCGFVVSDFFLSRRSSRWRAAPGDDRPRL